MNGHLVFWDHKLLEFDMLSQKVNNMWEFPGDLVVRIQQSLPWPRFDPCWGTEILQGMCLALAY